jgi:hypothetical protein
MIKIASLTTIATALLACGLSAAPAEAGPNRTFVSGTGTDSGTRTAPCKTFGFVITVTNPGGEIDVLDPAGYGAVTINHAISIVNDGVGVAAIGVSSGNAITISAGATDSVHLRGLTLTGLGSGSNGIQFNSGGNLAIENCVVRGFSNVGINISPTTSSSFSVSNTIAANNGFGIVAQPTGSAVVTGVLSKVTANNNFFGISVVGSLTAGASLNVTIVDSEASNNAHGVGAFSSSGHPPAAVMLRNVVATSNNQFGLEAESNAILRVAHSVVTGNGTGLFTSGGGILNSYGDNDIDGNTNDNFGALTTIPTH